MSSATLARPGGSVVAPSRELTMAAARLADAVAEYDAALDAGAAMLVLVKLDQEVAAATRCHRAAVAATVRH